jgi:hypothetical protein
VQALVVGAQPPDEVQHVGVAPHPCGEAPEAAQRLLGAAVLATAADVAVNAGGVGPISLDGDRGEAVLRDQALRDPCSLAVELVCAVAGLAQQHDARVADPGQERVVVAVIACQRVRLAPDGIEDSALTEG